MKYKLAILLTVSLIMIFACNAFADSFTVVTQGSSDSRNVALTFDGNILDSDTLPKILEELDRQDVLATFFINGYDVALNKGEVTDIIKKQHELGVSGFFNEDLTGKDFSYTKFCINQSKLNLKGLGAEPVYYRPSFGRFDNTVALAAAQAGFPRLILWSIGYTDVEEMSTGEAAEYIVSQTKAGYIISLSLSDSSKTLEMLPQIIEGLKSESYNFVTVRQLNVEGAFNGGYVFVDDVPEKTKQVAFTFEYVQTEDAALKVLDALDELGIKATFFLNGNIVTEYPEMAKEIVARGHQTGSSGYTRTDLTSLSYDEMRKDIEDGHLAIWKTTGVQPKVFRPVLGLSNANMGFVTARLGYDYMVLYNVNAGDWNGKNTDDIISTVTTKVSDGSIINFTATTASNAYMALPSIVADLRSRGFQIVTLNELTSGLDKSGAKGAPDGPFQSAVVAEERGTPLKLMNQYNYNGIFKVMYNSGKPTDAKYFFTGPSPKKAVAITFDDYGSYENVSQIVDILDYYDIKSTFFTTGRGVLHDPTVIKMLVDRGQEIGNHSMNHLHMATLTDEERQAEVIDAHRAIVTATGIVPEMFRVPFGEVDEVTKDSIYSTGYKYIIDSNDIEGKDWTDASAEENTNNILSKVNNGSIITLHMNDGYTTLQMLPMVIEALLEQGYEILTISELLRL